MGFLFNDLWSGVRFSNKGARSGQMIAEFAIFVPVMLVVALISINLMLYLDLSARFEQISKDSVISFGTAGPQESLLTRTQEKILAEIRSGMDCDEKADFEVKVIEKSSDTRSIFSVLPSQYSFECIMRFKPWPSRVNLPFLTFEAPVHIPYKTQITIDRYRSGVIQ